MIKRQVLVNFSPGLKMVPSGTVRSATNSTRSVPETTGAAVAAAVVAARGRVTVTVPAARVLVGVEGKVEGVAATISAILASAVWAADVKTACGSSVGVVSTCTPGLQADRAIAATSRKIHRDFFKDTISPPVVQPPSIPG